MKEAAVSADPLGGPHEELAQRPPRARAAMVTGASSGVGRAIAVALLGAGMDVCLVGRDRAALEATVRRAKPQGAASLILEADISRDRDLEALASTFERELDRLDVLVHSAGAILRGAVAAQSMSDFDHQHNVNVRGPYRLTQLMLPWLQRRGGDIVFVNSSLGLRSVAGAAQYAATKHALRAVADAVRDEVNERNIRVLTMFLGQTATPMQERLYALEAKPYRPEKLLQPDDVASMVMHALALPRTAEVTEIAIRPTAKPQ